MIYSQIFKTDTMTNSVNQIFEEELPNHKSTSRPQKKARKNTSKPPKNSRKNTSKPPKADQKKHVLLQGTPVSAAFFFSVLCPPDGFVHIRPEGRLYGDFCARRPEARRGCCSQWHGVYVLHCVCIILRCCSLSKLVVAVGYHHLICRCCYRGPKAKKL